MKLACSPTELRDWCERSALASTTYFKLRRELWEELVQLLQPGTPPGPSVTLSFDQFITIKGFLLSRNQDLSDDKRLAFDKALAELDQRCSTVLASPPTSGTATP